MQNEKKLDFLGELLGDPLTHEPVNIIITGDERRAIKVANNRNSRQYEIKENIPLMIPSEDVLVSYCGQSYVDAWKIVQAIGESSYLTEGPIGNFSHDDWMPAQEASQLIQEALATCKIILDVGCGLLPRPTYLKRLFSDVVVVGIDPMVGFEEREFPFVQAFGDFLPFQMGKFDAVIYFSSLDHLIKPSRSLRDAYKILKPGGYLIVEETIRPQNAEYWRWFFKNLFKPTRYNKFHNYAFTNSSLEFLLRRTGFKKIQSFLLSDPNEIFIIARK